jgi:hypothetical protein
VGVTTIAITAAQVTILDWVLPIMCEYADGLRVYDAFGLEGVLASLAQLATTRPETREAATSAILGIHWLQSRQHLAAIDEYNGTVFHCVHRGNLVFCEMNPVLVDLDVAMAGRSAVDVTSIIKASKAPAIDRGMAASIRTAVDHARDRGSK